VERPLLLLEADTAAVFEEDEAGAGEADCVPEAPEAATSFAVEAEERVEVMGVNDRLEVRGEVNVLGAAVNAEVNMLPEAPDSVGDAVETTVSVVPGAVVVTTAIVGVEVGGSVENVFTATPGISVRIKFGLRR
jgi:hypothetical protein